MIYNFETDELDYAQVSLLVYAVYKSRNKNKLKITPEFWGIIQSGIKASAKRSKNINEFLDKFGEKIGTRSIQPKFMASDISYISHKDDMGNIINIEKEKKFMIDIIEKIEDKKALKILKSETAFVMLLVRERIEREKEFKNILENEAGYDE